MGMDDFDGMESPIDSLLEQIKRGTRAMEDRQQSQSTIVPKVRRSRSGASVLSTDTDNLISEAKASEANISAEYVLRREKTKEILLISASMEQVDAAEKEASEVLHSLLSVERIEKQSLVTDPNNQQVVVVTTSDANPSLNNIQGDNVTSENQDQNAIQWHTPVTVHHALFTNMVSVNQTLSGDQVIWQLNQDPLTCNQSQNNLYTSSESASVAPAAEVPFQQTVQTETSVDSKCIKRKPSKNLVDKGTPTKRKNKSNLDTSPENTESSRLEESAQEVRERFEKGCECQEENCFVGLNPEYVYRHRLNIAELTKGEHDMYLMGVTMAVLTNPEETVRHKERRRLRAQYVFQGRRVCLDAFLYLENCTHYQLKRIRKHVMTHGVAPRVHGNQGKKPHNTFPLDSYRHAAAFLRQFIERHTSGYNPQQVYSSNKNKKSSNKNVLMYLPAEITRKTIHNAYREYCEHFDPSIKVMGYSSFRQYMKEQFPHVKFCKLEGSANKTVSSKQQKQQQPQQQQQQQPQQQQQQQQHQQGYLQENTTDMSVEIVSAQSSKLQENVMPNHSEDHHHETPAATIISTTGDVQQVTAIPIVLSQHNTQNDSVVSTTMTQSQQQQPTTYIVTPVSQLLQPSIGTGSGINSNNGNTFASYQLTPTSEYTSQQHINQSQVGTITVTSVQSNPYAFTTL
ncbi:Uncharacterized protein GBIM_19804 [Gryllus bimaculatus]|nr:Uncharacterized protein GBIM_19804 [Gryllus bimaculatus]